MGMEMLVALMAGLLALIGGAIAGYYIGRPKQYERPHGLLGQIQESLGIKL